MTRFLMVSLVLLFLNGCANLHLKKGGVAISKDTTAGIDDIGVGRLTGHF